jgi:hypothetical protein
MKTRVITARIDQYLNAEIEFLKSSLQLPNTTSVLTYAIHNLYESIKEEESQKSSLEMFEEKGLFGCFEGSPDLSTNYKNIISEVISKKHSRPSNQKKSSIRKTGKK